MEGAPTAGLGRLDGVLEHAKLTALQTPDAELLPETVRLYWGDAAQMLLDGSMPDESEQMQLSRYMSMREKAVANRVRYVDQGKFKAEEGTEFDDDFARAADDLMAFYATPYFGHTSRELIRHLAACRILEVSDSQYKYAQTVQSAKQLHDTVRVNDAGETVTEQDYNEALQSILNIT
jgi:hypothetical protein